MWDLSNPYFIDCGLKYPFWTTIQSSLELLASVFTAPSIPIQSTRSLRGTLHATKQYTVSLTAGIPRYPKMSHCGAGQLPGGPFINYDSKARFHLPVVSRLFTPVPSELACPLVGGTFSLD